MKHYYIWLTIILCVLLSSCGFTFKRAQPLPFHSIQLRDNGCPAFSQQFTKQLYLHHVNVLSAEEPTHDAIPILSIECPTLKEQPLVYDNDGQLRRQRYTYQVSARWENQTWPMLHTQQVREHQLNSNQTLGDDSEKALILKEMQRNLIRQLINQLSQQNYYAN